LEDATMTLTSTVGAFRLLRAGVAALNVTDHGLLQLITMATVALVTLVIAAALGPLSLA
jgi:hypothetical protein